MNAVDLELLCSALSIREKERHVGTLDINLKEKEERVLALCLVSKILTTKVVNKEAFINVMTSIWRVSEGVDIEALEENVFAFHFKNSVDRRLVQSGGPWTFDRALIALKEPYGIGDKTHMDFHTVEILVQIYNLPLLCMIEDTCMFLGTMIGEVKDVDLLATKQMGGRFIRVRVIISIAEPLMRSLRVDLLGNGTITTMLLRYERLQDYCFKCSRLGHSFNECTEPGEGNEATTEAMARLNVWLRAEIPPKRLNQRSMPFERQSWGNQGGRSYNRADQGNWRSRSLWKGLGKKPSESSIGGHNQNVSTYTSQLGEMHCSEYVSRESGQVGEQ